MASIFQRKGRSGWYINVPVPKALRPNRGCSVLRKAGNTHKEALANRSKVEAQVLKELGSELKKNSLVERIEVSYNKPDGPFAGQNLALSELPQSDKELLRDSYPVDVDDNGNPINPEEASLWLALEGKTTWQMWCNRRVAVEQIAKSTVSNWRSKFKGLSEWAKTDYLGDLTKQQAIQYKEHLISIGHETGTVINTIGAFSGFWNWAIDHEIVQQNIWSGLKKRLTPSKKEPLPPDEVFEAATHKAATITTHRKTIDYQFLIQRYTGCRQCDAAGLRHSDIDLKRKTICFQEWEQEVHFVRIRGGERRENMVRRLKGRSSDERTVPINSALHEVLKGMPLTQKTVPIWPTRYKSTNDTWGAHHTGEYTNKYGFSSHKLRSYAITRLTLKGVSPFIIYEITRHKIAGLSDVIQQYTRPSTDELRQAMEILI